MLSQDRSLVAGLKGGNDAGWSWDVSYNYGYNHIGFKTQNTINYSLGTASPTSFYDGALEYTQNVVNADVTKTLDWGLAYPATLSLAAEYRREQWNHSPGEPAPYGTRGAPGFPGSTTTNYGHTDPHTSTRSHG